MAMIRSSEWTGREGWRSTVHFGWRSKKQLPLFMVWELYYDEDGEVCHGTVLFNSMTWQLDLRYYFPRLSRMLVKMGWI